MGISLVSWVSLIRFCGWLWGRFGCFRPIADIDGLNSTGRLLVIAWTWLQITFRWIRENYDMANSLTLKADWKRINDMLFKLFQSTRLNFMLGSGASMPAINVAGDIEGSVQGLYKAGDELLAEQTLCSFIQRINTATAKLVQSYPDPKSPW